MLVRAGLDLPVEHRHRSRPASLRAIEGKTTVEDAVVDAVSQVQGAFSFVMMTRDRLIAVRDPHGFRPLALGRLDDAYVVCSETCAMDLIGATYVRDVEPGEILDHQRRRACGRSSRSRRRSSRTACSSTCISRGRTAIVFGKSVNEVRTNLGRMLAREQRRADADVVVPVPDSGVCAAMGFAEESSIPLRMGLIRNHYVGRTFIQPQSSIRHFGVKVKLNPGEEHSRRQARRARRRLAGARDDEPEDREDGASGGREGSARAHQLSADDLAVFLRRRHAAAVPS